MNDFINNLVLLCVRHLIKAAVQAFVLRSYYEWFGLQHTGRHFTIWPFIALVLAVKVLMPQEAVERTSLYKKLYKAYDIETESESMQLALFCVLMALFWFSGMLLAILQYSFLNS